MKLLDYLKDNLIYLDGGMGTLLQAKGMRAGELPERWNITHADVIKDIHLAYYNAGSNIVNTNTFGANILKFSEAELEEVIGSALNNAKRAREESTSVAPKWIALDIGPTGRMLKPYGDLDFERAVEIFATTIKMGVKHGADLIFIETMSDSYETKAALLAAKENSNLPVFVSNAYSENNALLTGASPKAMVALLEGMGADAIGVNCSFGPKGLSKVVKEYLKYASVPVILKPNAGLPKVENGVTKYDITPQEFAQECKALVMDGVRVVGGCCGTTPSYIEALYDDTNTITPIPTTERDETLVSSGRVALEIGKAPILVGERINPTGKPRFREALKNGDIDYILKEGISQEERGVHVLDVNVGIPDIDEVEMLTSAVKELQAVVVAPLQIDTSNTLAMEKALRIYNGKAMINSVNGKAESMEAVFPLVKKYGGVVVALTLDERGIPVTAEERVAIAEKIIQKAESYGIQRKDIIVDPLAMTISADKDAGNQTLKAVELLKAKGIHTILGVSNVSFGLPKRDYINSMFFALALEKGLSAGIINPNSTEIMKAYFVANALKGKDENFASYISFAESVSEQTTATLKSSSATLDGESPLQRAIIKGLKEEAQRCTESLLQQKAPLDIINGEIVPALDIVGVAYEQGRAYLPNLLMSADSAKVAFEVIKAKMPQGGATKGTFVIATVKGDIHDIGKNIVKLLLENYGFKVVDLGKDVEPKKVVEAVIKHNAPLCGLSALMTTTVPSMEETIKELRAGAPWCKICVGGAVLNGEYADKIGADKYCKDAMETVRYALNIVE